MFDAVWLSQFRYLQYKSPPDHCVTSPVAEAMNIRGRVPTIPNVSNQHYLAYFNSILILVSTSGMLSLSLSAYDAVEESVDA
jgi:hypothetical protein